MKEGLNPNPAQMDKGTMITTTNNKYEVMKRSRGSAWNENMRTKVHMFQYDNTCLPEMFRGHSPYMVNTLLNLGWFAKDALALLKYADATGDHPDWSESDWDELLFHFQQIEPLAIDLGDS